MVLIEKLLGIVASMGETQNEKAKRFEAIVNRLSSGRSSQGNTAPYGIRSPLEFNSPLQLLVAVLLSAQCTDRRVNMVTPRLFARFPTAQAFAEAAPADIEPYIRSCGLYRNKAQALVRAGKAIVSKGGAVPTSREELLSLPGIGNKSAGVIAMHLSGEAALPVDTHVARLAFRMGLSTEKKPDLIERDLQKLLPQEMWHRAHYSMVLHGRNICLARKPECEVCPVNDLCPKCGIALRPS